MDILGIQDLIFVPLLTAVIYIWARRHVARSYPTREMRRFFMTGLFARLGGGLLVGLIYIFVYRDGDLLIYYNRARYINYLINSDIWNNWIVLFPEFYQDKIMTIPYFPVYLLEKANAFIVVRIASVLCYFFFDSFYAVNFMFGLWGFWGSWKLFLVFRDYKPAVTKSAAIYCLYLPSIVMWGSGILKDTLAFGGLGLVVYCVYQLFIKRQYKLKYFLGALIAGYTVGVAKSYILLALAPSLVFFIFNFYGSSVRSVFVRTVLFPMIMALVVVLSFGLLTLISSTFTSYNLDNLESKAEGFQRWHTIRSEQVEGSGYTLPTGNKVVNALAAINVTFFRPYIWESRKPIVFLAAIESLYFLFFTIQTIRKTGLRYLLKALVTDPMISFCFIFAMIFGFAVGSTSYNFGALVRFKIPCLPFYMAALSLSRVKKEEEFKLKGR